MMEEGGYEGRFPFRMQGKRVPHLWGLREQWWVMDRVSGWEAGLLPGGRSYGTPASCTAALESNWNPLLQLPHLCPLSDVVFLPFFSPISLHFSRYCMSAAAKILLLQHILPGGKEKLQVYCQHSVVFIYICPFCSVLLNNTFGSYSILTGE